jgi:hypothetical protein
MKGRLGHGPQKKTDFGLNWGLWTVLFCVSVYVTYRRRGGFWLGGNGAESERMSKGYLFGGKHLLVGWRIGGFDRPWSWRVEAYGKAIGIPH